MAVRGNETVRVAGLSQFRKELRSLDEPRLVEDLKDAHVAIANKVVVWARAKAATLGGMEAKAASSLKASRAQNRAQVTLGGRGYEFAAGAEFGAYQNKLRLIKGKTGAGRSRAYLVRNESRLGVAKAARRIEAQRNQRTGQAINITGRVRGWNQFRPWRGNRAGAGYWLFPSIGTHTAEIVDDYGDAIERIAAKAFPD